MNPERGWNPNLEESYLLGYSKYEDEIWTNCKSGFYIWPLKFSAHDPFSIPIYSECTKTTRFSIVGFFRLGVKLGFDFPHVLPNQNYRPWSLKFDFDEERNPTPGLLKNSSSVESPNSHTEN